MRLVYLSPVPWDSFAQRPHKFVEWFHGRTGGPVLWVDPYPTRFPHWRDLRRSDRSASASQHTSPPTWLTLLKPGGLPIEPIPGSGWVNGLLWQGHMRTIGDFVTGGRTLLAIGKPSVFAVELLNRLRDCSSLYDAMDDFPAFYTGLSRIALMRRESEVARRVCTILVSSSALKARWMNFHKDVRLVHNGLDHLALQEVGPIQRVSRTKIFGYVGTIASWFDWDWIFALARARSHDEIRLIGPILTPPNYKLPSNIKLLPACDHRSSLIAMAQFDVGLIPFKENILTLSVDPIKFYEYRGFDLPVISTDFGEMKFRSGFPRVYLAKSQTEILDVANSAIQFGKNFDAASNFRMENSWERRFDEAKILVKTF